MNRYPLKLDPKQGTSFSYLIELRKLTSQNREDYCEDHGVGECRSNAGLPWAEKTTRTWRNGQEETWAERQKECRSHYQIRLGQHETHHPGNDTVNDKEHESVEHNGHLIGLSVHVADTPAICGQKDAGAERKKKGSWNSNFLRRNVWKHDLIYTDIILSTVPNNELKPVVKSCIRHNLIIQSQIINVILHTNPNVC